MDLLRQFSDQQFARALESWSWIPQLQGKRAMIASPFGDVFLQSPDGPYWVLSLLDGSFEQCASSAAELQAVLDTDEGQDDLLLGGLAMAAWRAGLVPGADEVLAFKIPPVIGGTVKVENIDVMDFVVIANLSGQLHRQLADVPPGTAIPEFRIDSAPTD